MLLAIDSGNTNIVFAVFSNNGELHSQWRASSDSNRTADELGVWLNQLMVGDNLACENITGAIIATVVPANLFDLQDLCRRFFDCEPVVVGDPLVRVGLKILIDNPKEVGADRLCNAVSAHINYSGQVTIIDFGTATSFDVVDGDGNYRGGVIFPGIHLSLEALHMGTALLPRINIERPEVVIGTGTVLAMQSGIFWGYVSMIEGMVARIKDEVGGEMTIIATGGLASMFTDVTDAIDHWEKDLTLFGLLEIFRLNQP